MDPNLSAENPPQPVLSETMTTTPAIPQTQNQTNVPAPKTKPPLIFLIIALIILFTISLSSVTYLLAYEKINIGNDPLQRQIADFVQGLPFMPKTPKYLIKNTRRKADIYAILNAIHYYAADNHGVFPKGISGQLKSISAKEADLCSLLVPIYLHYLPVDPSINNGEPITNCKDPNYDTGYKIATTDNGKKITIQAPLAELGEVISVTK